MAVSSSVLYEREIQQTILAAKGAQARVKTMNARTQFMWLKARVRSAENATRRECMLRYGVKQYRNDRLTSPRNALKELHKGLSFDVF